MAEEDGVLPWVAAAAACGAAAVGYARLTMKGSDDKLVAGGEGAGERAEGSTMMCVWMGLSGRLCLSVCLAGWLAVRLCQSLCVALCACLAGWRPGWLAPPNIFPEH
jgi:hypothetical protein